MKLIRKQKENFTFLLEKEEKPVLLALLHRYPLVPAAHQPLSKSIVSPENEADQRLLDEALAERRQENQRQVLKLLKDPHRLGKVAAGWHVTLSVSDIEWLLQVLNDVRVGSWIRLGSPDMEQTVPELNDETAVHAWTMETAGFFQTHLLAALS